MARIRYLIAYLGIGFNPRIRNRVLYKKYLALKNPVFNLKKPLPKF